MATKTNNNPETISQSNIISPDLQADAQPSNSRLAPEYHVKNDGDRPPFIGASCLYISGFQPYPSKPCPAIITEVYAENVVGLVFFSSSANQTAFPVAQAPFDAGKSFGTWHWPE